MKPSGPVLIGLVLAVIFYSASNGGADESDDDAAAAAAAGEQDDDRSGEDDERSGGGADSDESTGRGSANGSANGAEGDPEGSPDTGGADVPELPEAPGGGDPVTLTFDDGPHPEYTPQILDMLASYDATAVFCVVGENVGEHPELVRRVVEEGHALCNHSYTHDAELAKRPPEQIETEISDTAAAITEAAPDAPVPFFRQPAMFTTPQVAPVAKDRGMTILDWTVDPRDWARPGASAIVDTVLSEVHSGAVVLLHDGGGDRTQTVQALSQVLAELEAAGYETVIPTMSSPDA